MTLRRVAIILIALQCIGLTGVTQSYAATPKPKPTPKITSLKKVLPKKKSTTTKKKTTSKKVVTAKKKKVTSKKKVITKKKIVVHHYIYHKPVLKPVPPSPSPGWPPKGFTSFGFAYAKIPTGQELVGILSAVKDPAAKINSCASNPKHPSSPAYSCAAILVASAQKCTWWKVTSTVTGIDPANPPARIALGDITTYAIGAAAKAIQTIFLVSPIPLQTGVKFTAIHALCGSGPATDPVPSTTFAPASSPSASPIEAGTSTPTPAPTPAPTP